MNSADLIFANKLKHSKTNNADLTSMDFLLGNE